MLYLNRVDGGNTRFFEDNKKKIVVELPPQPGQVLLFDPDIWHDGSKVLSGEKYIIRTEVMYQKI
jgi:ectoine hydroxylase-related dioxygenase (phytanoyl-CoA dioxygenase family)